MKTGDKFLHRGWKFLILNDYGDGTEGTVKVVERGPKLFNVIWVLGEEKRFFTYEGGGKPCIKINEETDMITRVEFNRMNNRKEDPKFVSKKEMVKWLKNNGRSLSLEDTKKILKVYFGVEEGDTILSSSDTVPSGSKGITVDGNARNKFTILKISHSGISSNPCLYTNGTYYGGANESSGIFAFFINKDFTVLRDLP